MYLQAFLDFDQCSARWHKKKCAPDPAAKMHLALLHCGTYPRKLMVGWSQKKHLGLSKYSSISHFHVFNFGSNLVCWTGWFPILIVLVVQVFRERYPKSTPSLVLQGYILPTPWRCLNQECEQAQSHTNDLLGTSRNKRERRGLSTPSIPPPISWYIHTHTQIFVLKPVPRMWEVIIFLLI